MHHERRVDLVAIGLMALGALVGVLAWPALPADLVIHWSGGSPDTVVAKPLAIFGVFALGVATVVVTRVAPDSLTSTPGGTNVTILFVGVVFAWVEGVVVLWNLWPHFSVGLAILPVIVLAGLLVAYSRVG